MYVCVAVFTVYTGKGKSFGSSCSLQLTVKARVEFEYREAAACTCFAGLVEAKLCLGMTGVANPNLSEELPSWLSIPLHFFFFFWQNCAPGLPVQPRSGTYLFTRQIAKGLCWGSQWL